MKLVLDANILFSALIKDSMTADLLFDKNIELFTPEFIFEEYDKYKSLLLNKTYRNDDDFFSIFSKIKGFINTIQKEKIIYFLKNALEICPDKKDVMYFALALYLNCPIWSNDKKLKEQNKIPVYNTEELKKLLNK